MEFAEDVRSAILAYSDAWRVLEEDEVSHAASLSGAACSHLRREFENAIGDQGERPLLLAYMCDGWGVFVESRQVKRHANIAVHHHGRHEEFLLQRFVLRVFGPGGHQQVRILALPPRSLRLGRSSWNIFTAASGSLGTPRACGRRGISVMVYLQDGALHDSSLREFRGQHEAWYEGGMLDDGFEQDTVHDMDWAVW